MTHYLTRCAATAPGRETCLTLPGGDSLTIASADGITADALATLEAIWQTDDVQMLRHAAGASVHYALSDTMPRGMAVRVATEPGRVLGTFCAEHVHPATAAALAGIAERLLASDDRAAAVDAP